MFECDVREGWLWPSHDKELILVADWVKDVGYAMPYVKTARNALQAGGSVGLWPDALAKLFENVITLEPDPHSFHCLMHNCARHENVIALNAALGNNHVQVEINREDYPENVGAQYVDPRKAGGIPMLKIDDMGYASDNPLDLLCLDIEGWERDALLGGVTTITRDHPIIMVENKPLKQMGVLRTDAGVVPKLLASWGYKQVAAVHRDLVFQYQE